MFPADNASPANQPWARNVTDRAYEASQHAVMANNNALALAGNTKTNYELIDSRIANINTFTNGLFEQKAYTHQVTTYAQLAAVPVLYQYSDAGYNEYAVTVRTVPFAEYNDLAITGDGYFHGYTTNTGATSISVERPIRPMIQATIPPLGMVSANGTYTENALTYASRWTVENFESFANYNIPGNLVASSYSSWSAFAGPTWHPDAGTTELHYSTDGHTSYSMHYTRKWIMEYMDAITRYTTANSPPPAGARYVAPDVNQVQIVLGYYYRIWTGAATNVLFLNDARLTFNAGSTFSLQGIKNMGY